MPHSNTCCGNPSLVQFTPPAGQVQKRTFSIVSLFMSKDLCLNKESE